MEFKSQAARDAQVRGYGDKSYWVYLDRTAQEHHAYFLAHGDPERAASMLTESLAESLQGNDGE